jgi:carbon storage regulator CsrA
MEGNLILSRKEGQAIAIGESVVTVQKVKGNRVTLAIKADQGVPVKRTELLNPRPRPGTDGEAT